MLDTDEDPFPEQLLAELTPLVSLPSEFRLVDWENRGSDWTRCMAWRSAAISGRMCTCGKGSSFCACVFNNWFHLDYYISLAEVP